MYQEDSLSYLLAPQSKQTMHNLERRRAEWLEDYLYLPSHINFDQREEMILKHGKSALLVDKDVSFGCLIAKSFFIIHVCCRVV